MLSPSLDLQGPPLSASRPPLQSHLTPLFNHAPAILICFPFLQFIIIPLVIGPSDIWFPVLFILTTSSSLGISLNVYRPGKPNFLNQVGVCSIYSHSSPHIRKFLEVHRDYLFNYLSALKTISFLRQKPRL